jgi:azurin
VNLRSLGVAVLVGAATLTATRHLAAEQAKPAAAAPRMVVITAGDPVGEKMSYSKSVITAKPGEKIKLRLMAIGQLPRSVMTHNWVLLKLGSDPKKFADAAAMTPATGYIPASMKSQILAQTEMVGPGETSEIVFTAPTTPGTYPYLCTFAQRFAAGMSGSLIVK